VSGWPATILIVTVGVLVFADAWMAGIRRRPNESGFLNISPLAWSIAINLLFVVSFPLYLLNRNRLRTRKGSTAIWGLIIVFGGLLMLLVLLWILSISGVLGRR
jgi:hypothetical protein